MGNEGGILTKNIFPKQLDYITYNVHNITSNAFKQKARGEDFWPTT